MESWESLSSSGGLLVQCVRAVLVFIFPRLLACFWGCVLCLVFLAAAEVMQPKILDSYMGLMGIKYTMQIFSLLAI